MRLTHENNAAPATTITSDECRLTVDPLQIPSVRLDVWPAAADPRSAPPGLRQKLRVPVMAPSHQPIHHVPADPTEHVPAVELQPHRDDPAAKWTVAPARGSLKPGTAAYVMLEGAKSWETALAVPRNAESRVDVAIYRGQTLLAKSRLIVGPDVDDARRTRGPAAQLSVGGALRSATSATNPLQLVTSPDGRPVLTVGANQTLLVPDAAPEGYVQVLDPAAPSRVVTSLGYSNKELGNQSRWDPDALDRMLDALSAPRASLAPLRHALARISPSTRPTIELRDAVAGLCDTPSSPPPVPRQPLRVVWQASTVDGIRARADTGHEADLTAGASFDVPPDARQVTVLSRRMNDQPGFSEPPSLRFDVASNGRLANIRGGGALGKVTVGDARVPVDANGSVDCTDPVCLNVENHENKIVSRTHVRMAEPQQPQQQQRSLSSSAAVGLLLSCDVVRTEALRFRVEPADPAQPLPPSVRLFASVNRAPEQPVDVQSPPLDLRRGLANDKRALLSIVARDADNNDKKLAQSLTWVDLGEAPPPPPDHDLVKADITYELVGHEGALLMRSQSRHTLRASGHPVDAPAFQQLVRRLDPFQPHSNIKLSFFSPDSSGKILAECNLNLPALLQGSAQAPRFELLCKDNVVRCRPAAGMHDGLVLGSIHGGAEVNLTQDVAVRPTKGPLRLNMRLLRMIDSTLPLTVAHVDCEVHQGGGSDNPDWRQQLARIIDALKDPALPPGHRMTNEIMANHARSKLGHLPLSDMPKEVADAVLQFLDRLRPELETTLHFCLHNDVTQDTHLPDSAVA